MVSTRQDEIGILSKTFDEMIRGLIILQKLSALVSGKIRDALKKEEGELETLVTGRVVKAVVLATDIRSFTNLSEKHAVLEITALLNVHFDVNFQGKDSLMYWQIIRPPDFIARARRYLNPDEIFAPKARQAVKDLADKKSAHEGFEITATVLYLSFQGTVEFLGSADSRAYIAALDKQVSQVSRVIAENGGVIDKLIGDKLLVYFPHEEHPYVVGGKVLDSIRLSPLHRRSWRCCGFPGRTRRR